MSFSHRKSKGTLQSPLPTACRTVIENLENRQLLSANAWQVSYWGNTDNAGTDGVQPNYVVQDTGSTSAGTVPNISSPFSPSNPGPNVQDAINYTAGGATTVPPQLANIGVTSSWTAGPGGCSFSARFDGILTAPETATYTFYPGGDDGDELIVDGQILDNSLNASRGVTYETCPISVQWAAGSTHQVSYLYQNGGGGWGQVMKWSDNVSIAQNFIPITAITLPAGPINGSVQAPAGGDTLKWSAYNPSAGGTVATDSASSLAYDIYRAPVTAGGTLPTVSAFTKIASAVTGDSYTDTTAVAGKAYDYRVTSAGVALTPSADILNDANNTGLASALDGTSANSTGTNDTLIGSGDGLTAQYFNSSDEAAATHTGVNDDTAGSNADNLTQDHAGVYSRIDTQIATDNSTSTTPPGVPAAFTTPNGTASFSIRWDGYVMAPETGSYVFYPDSDDNERFAVGNPVSLTGATAAGNANASDYGVSTPTIPGNANNETVIAEGTGTASGTAFIAGTALDFLNNGGRGDTAGLPGDTSSMNVSGGALLGTEVYATAGQLIPIQMDYNQGGGGWHYQLNWAGPGFGSRRVSPSASTTATFSLLTAPDLYAAQAEAPTATGIGGFQSAILTLSLPLSGYSNGGTAADSYNVYRSTVAGTQGPLIGTVSLPNANANSATTTTTFNDTGSGAGTSGATTYTAADTTLQSFPTTTTYYYTVTAVAGGIESAPTVTSITTTQSAPTTPNTAVARNSNGTTTVSWPAIQFAAGFTVLRSTDGTNFTALAAGTNLPPSTTSFTDTTANNSTFYYYQVTASNAAGSNTSGSVYVANGDGFAVTYFANPLAGATGSGFKLNTTNQPTSDTLSYWQDVANPLTPNPNAAGSGFSGTNSFQTVDSTINFTGADATKPASTPTGFNSADVTGPGHSISGEWDFTVIPQYSGNYTFYPSTDDGTEFYVDGKLLDDQNLPGARGNTPDKTPVTDGTIAPSIRQEVDTFAEGGTITQGDLYTATITYPNNTTYSVTYTEGTVGTGADVANGLQAAWAADPTATAYAVATTDGNGNFILTGTTSGVALNVTVTSSGAGTSTKTITTPSAANANGEPIGIYGGNAISWTAGSTHTIRMLWANGGGGWDAHLYWSSGGNTAAAPNANFGQPYAIVPGYQAYAAVSPANVTANLTGASYGTPTTAVAVGNESAVQLTWDSIQADSYQVYRSTTAPTSGTVSTYGTLITTVAATPGSSPGIPTYSFTDQASTDTAAGSPVDGTQYYYTIVPQTANPVAGVGGAVGGLVSGTPTIVTGTPLAAAPAAPTITSKIGNLVTPEVLGENAVPASNVTISWGAVPFAASYNVFRAVVTAGTAGAYTMISPLAGVTTTSFTDATAAIGTIYSYEVEAVNSATTTANAASSTSTAKSVDLLDGVIQNYWAANTIWGSTINTSNATTSTSANGAYYTVGNPTISSFQPNVGYVDTSGGVNAPPGGSQGTTYSVELTGQIHITNGGYYTFNSATDDSGFLFVDGSLVAAGSYGTFTQAANYTDTTVNPINLAANTTYNFQFYEEQGAGGDQYVMYENGPDTGNVPLIAGTTPAVTATTAGSDPLTDQIGAPAPVTIGTPTVSSTSPYTITVTFPDVNTNEQSYQLQRSTSPTFASGISTVQTLGLQDNQDIPSGSAAGNQPTVTMTDSTTLAPNTTYYYRVVGVNFSGATPSNIMSATTGAPANTSAAFEAYFYANEWWSSAQQNTAGFMSTAGPNTGVNSTIDPVNLTATDSTLLLGPTATTASGSDTGTGTLEANGSGAKYPDPNSNIGTGDNFSDVFTGQVQIHNTGVFTFAANTDDDGYMYVDDKLVSAYPGGHGPNSAYTNYPVTLTAGTHDIEFFESNGGGGWAWNWLYSGADTSNVLQLISAADINSVGNPVTTPTTFTAATTANPTQATITWSNSNTSAIRYVVQRATNSTFTTGLTSVDFGLPSTPANSTSYPATTSYTDTGLALGQQYFYRILVENYDGTATSPTATITTANQYPVIPSIVADQDVNGNIQVSFPAEAYAGITGYQLLRSVNGGAYAAVTGSPFAQGAGPYTFTDPASGLTSGNSYQYEVIVTGTGAPANSNPGISNPLNYVVTGTPLINHSTGFAGETDLTLGGNGAFTPVVTSNGQLQISSTLAAGNEATNSYETTPVAIGADFSTSFDFQFTNPADNGFAFVIQSEAKNINGGSGAGFGYTGVTPSLAVVFNQSANVTQTQLGVNGVLIGTAANMSATLGNAFNSANATTHSTDIFQVSLTYQASSQTLFEAIRDTTTGLGYSTSYNLASYGLIGKYLLGPGSDDYLGFTAGTSTTGSQQNILDWTVNDTVSTVTAAQPPSVSATQDVNGNVQVSFPAPPVNGFTSTTYQVLRSVNGGAYAAVGSPISYSSTAAAYTYQDNTAGLTTGYTYQYKAIIVGTTPVSPATSNSVYYVYNPLVTHTGSTAFTAADNGTDLQFNDAAGDAPTTTGSGQLQLTDSTNNETNSVFTTTPVTINSNWQTTFDYQITNPGADGMTFTIQSLGAGTVGGGGGSFGYVGTTGGFASPPTSITSVAFALNMYNTVTQTVLGVDGALTPVIDMSGTLGNAFHVTPSSATTDTFQVSLAYQNSTGNFFQTVRDTRTGQAFSQTITPTIYAGYLSTLANTTITAAQAQGAMTALFSSPVYIGFTSATGGANSTQDVNDWVFNTTGTAPTVSSISPTSGPTTGGTTVTINGTGFTGATGVTFGGVPATNVTVVPGSNGTQITAVDPAATAGGVVDVQVATNTGGISTTSTADQFTYIAANPPTVVSITTNDGEDTNIVQESEIRQIVVTFSQPVTLTQPGAFSLALLNGGGSGGSPISQPGGTYAPIDVSSVLQTATSSAGGTVWTITFSTGTNLGRSNTFATGASNATDASGSLNDGIYTFTVNNAGVTNSGTALTGTNSYTFHRLYGELTGTANGTSNGGSGFAEVTAGDISRFNRTYLQSFGATNYNASFDFAGGDSEISAGDSAQLNARYLKTLYLPPSGV